MAKRKPTRLEVFQAIRSLPPDEMRFLLLLMRAMVAVKHKPNTYEDVTSAWLSAVAAETPWKLNRAAQQASRMLNAEAA